MRLPAPVDLLPAVQTAYEAGTNVYFAHLRFRDKVLGAQPKSRDIMRRWLESRALPPEVIEKQLAQITPEDRISEDEQDKWTGFFNDEHGPWIGGYAVKANIREMLTTLGFTMANRGIKQTHQHLVEIVACDPSGTPLEGAQRDRLHFYRGDEVLAVPDGSEDHASRVSSPQGDRSVIKKYDYMVGVELYFLIVVPANLMSSRDTAVVNDEVIARVMAHAGNDALGARRPNGYGKFDILGLSRFTANPWIKARSAQDEEEGPKKGGRRRKAGDPIPVADPDLEGEA